ncbi:unnamed protein product, partial [Prorocentrum cordatum]
MSFEPAAGSSGQRRSPAGAGGAAGAQPQQPLSQRGVEPAAAPPQAAVECAGAASAD